MTKFYALTMRGQNFNMFGSEFQCLAAELDHNNAILVSKLIYKLAPGFQCQLTTKDKQLTNLYKYADQCKYAYLAMKNTNQNQATHNQFKLQCLTSTAYISKSALVALTLKALNKVPNNALKALVLILASQYSCSFTPNQNRLQLTKQEFVLLRQ